MEQKLKDLLVKDLCARLPYGVKCNINFNQKDGTLTTELLQGVMTDSVSVKPYLRSFSTMTEEEKEELLAIVKEESSDIVEQLKNNDCGIKEGKYHFNSYKELDWILAHHFDYRGLIPMGLALEAPADMYELI